MTSRCAEGFATGVVVGFLGAVLGGVAYFVVARRLLDGDAHDDAPRDPATTSALEASRNPTFTGRD